MDKSGLSTVPLDWIRAFEVAARKGSFTAAAKELGLTQVAISQRINNLERHAGVSLFIRKPRGVSLSVEGEAWLPYVSSALYELDQSYEDLFGVQRHKLTISASASVIEHWLAPRLNSWQTEKLPNITFSTMVLEAEAAHQDENIRIRYGTGNEWSDNLVHRLFREKLAPVASPELLNQGSSWEDLPRISVAGPRMGWQEFIRNTGISATPVPHLRFDSMSAALAAAKTGAGVVIASLPLCARLLDEKQLIQVSDNCLHSTLTYWMIAGKRSVTKRDWTLIVQNFAEET